MILAALMFSPAVVLCNNVENIVMISRLKPSAMESRHARAEKSWELPYLVDHYFGFGGIKESVWLVYCQREHIHQLERQTTNTKFSFLK